MKNLNKCVQVFLNMAPSLPKLTHAKSVIGIKKASTYILPGTGDRVPSPSVVLVGSGDPAVCIAACKLNSAGKHDTLCITW